MKFFERKNILSSQGSFGALIVTLTLLLQTTTALEKPSHITLKAGVLHAPPFASIETRADGALIYDGFEPSLLKRLQIFAKEDNVTLEFDLKPSPPQYGDALDLVANDCNTTDNPKDAAECQQFDLIVGDYYCNPDRSVRVDFTPSWLRTTMSTIKYLDKTSQDYTTLTQANNAQATVCVPDGTYLMTVVMDKFPDANYIKCQSEDECLATLKAEECVLYVNDELLLRYRQASDPSLEVTREQFNTQYLVWPMTYNLPLATSMLMKKWIYAAVSNATLDELYFEYFQKELCPVGTAGKNCELPCDPDHGTSDARGVCVCESVRFTGDDCSIEIPEEKNMIPFTLKLIAYIMVGINFGVILICGIWLFWQRNSPQIRVCQPFFLFLVLFGCAISTSTIIVMAEEDEGDGPVKACMAIPWLYSVGFSVTFGTLFAKIRRVYLIFMKAAHARTGSSMTRRNQVTWQETTAVIGAVLLVDVFLLTAWTIMSPLEWERTVISADQFGAPLESQGYCTSEHWEIFAGIIASLHLLLMAIACYMCYAARDIPTKFSEGKYLSIAMISNLQIFVVAVPILIIMGNDPQTSFFVRSVVVWMNDLAVVTLIFGNLIYSVHFEGGGTNEEKVKEAVDRAISRVQRKSVVEGSSDRNTNSREDAYSGNRDSVISHATANSAARSNGAKEIKERGPKHSRRSSTKQSKKPAKRHTGASEQLSRYSENFYNGGSDAESDQDTFVDEIDKSMGRSSRRGASAPPEQKPFDVLRNEKQSWAGLDDSDGSNSEYGNGNDTAESGQMSSITDANSVAKSGRSSLPPAKLPETKKTHLSYAESRISRVRGKHAGGSRRSGRSKQNGSLPPV